MLRALLVLLSLATAEADLALIGAGVPKWLPSERVTRCPVHSKIQPTAVDGGEGTSFVVKAADTSTGWSKRFSLIETYTPAGGLQGFEGLQLNFTTSGLSSWKLRLHDGQTNIRFVHEFNKPDGVHQVSLPWTSFPAESCRRRKIAATGYSIQPPSISKLEIYLPNGPQQAQLTIQGMHAMRDLSAMVPDTSKSPVVVDVEDDMAPVMDYFDGPFVKMGITGHNDFGLMSVSTPLECAEECAKTSGCNSFDHGARGKVDGECWLSRADRKSVGNSYESWPLYNYYELKQEPAVSGTAVSTPTDAQKDARPTFDEGRTSASHARRLSSTPVACGQAVVALAFFLAL